MEDGEGSTATVFNTNDIYSFINDKYADFEFKVGEYITLSYDWELTGTPSSNTTYPTMIRAEINDTPWRYGAVVNSVGTNSPTTHVKTITANEKSGHIRTIYKIDSDSRVSNAKKARFRIDNLLSNYYVTISNLKLEKGNKATDWTPAPEDIDAEIASKETKDAVETIRSNLQSQVTTAKNSIDTINGIIKNLVVDKNGHTLMTQTGSGWVFNMGSITSAIDSIARELATKGPDATKDISDLQGLLAALQEQVAYVECTYENSTPKIILGSKTSPFKVVITNTQISFMNGSSTPAYINGNIFYGQNITVLNQLKIGENPGFIWQRRDNGNLSLVYSSN